MSLGMSSQDPIIALLYWDSLLKRTYAELNGVSIEELVECLMGWGDDFSIYATDIETTNDIFRGFFNDMEDPEFRERVRLLADMIKL